MENRNFNDYIESLTDEFLIEAVKEILQDQETNDGVIRSEKHREVAKELAIIANGQYWQFLTHAQLMLLFEFAKRTIRS